MRRSGRRVGLVLLPVGGVLLTLSYFLVLLDTTLTEVVRPVFLLSVPLALSGAYLLLRDGQEVEVVYCSNCGYDNPVDTERCNRCGEMQQ